LLKKYSKELGAMGALEVLKGDAWDYVDVDAFECEHIFLLIH
jgi:hypothetical protein